MNSDEEGLYEEELQQFRSFIRAADQKAQEDFDKTVIVLSGSALGISMTFLKDIAGDDPLVPWSLLLAWIAWAFSVTFVLASYYFSQLSLRKTLHQIEEDTIYEQEPGGVFSKVTEKLNAAGGVLFLVGLVFMIIFVFFNLR